MRAYCVDAKPLAATKKKLKMNHKIVLFLTIAIFFLSCESERNSKENSSQNIGEKSVDKNTSEAINYGPTKKSDETIERLTEKEEVVTKTQHIFKSNRILEKDTVVESFAEIEEVEMEPPLNNEKYLPNGIIEKDSTIWIMATMEKYYKIFVYETPSIKAKKLFLFSVFTKDVEGNPSNCTYGSFYDTSGMDRLKITLKYTSDTLNFMKLAIFQDEIFKDFSYVEKKWLEFDNKE